MVARRIGSLPAATPSGGVRSGQPELFLGAQDASRDEGVIGVRRFPPDEAPPQLLAGDRGGAAPANGSHTSSPGSVKSSTSSRMRAIGLCVGCTVSPSVSNLAGETSMRLPCRPRSTACGPARHRRSRGSPPGAQGGPRTSAAVSSCEAPTRRAPHERQPLRWQRPTLRSASRPRRPRSSVEPRGRRQLRRVQLLVLRVEHADDTGAILHECVGPQRAEGRAVDRAPQQRSGRHELARAVQNSEATGSTAKHGEHVQLPHPMLPSVIISAARAFAAEVRANGEAPARHPAHELRDAGADFDPHRRAPARDRGSGSALSGLR